MPKFVWEITSRGAWAPQLFHGELPREMTTPENRARYAVHDISTGDVENLAEYVRLSGRGSLLIFLAQAYPPPPAFTGKENDDAV